MDLGQVTLLQYALAAVLGFVTGIIAGIAGYGGGLLLPLVLVPVMGPTAVVPIISVVTMFSNATRVMAFWSHLDRPKMWLIAAFALPTTIVGAWGFTRLTGRGALLLIGCMLVTLVPVRRWLKSLKGPPLQGDRLLAASAGYGLISGGTSGAGVILLSMLMWAGLQGRGVIATDAAISFLVGFAKIGTFQAFGALPLSAWIMALVIGLATAPGAFIAKRLASKLTLDQHTGILDAVVIIGGVGMFLQGLRS